VINKENRGAVVPDRASMGGKASVKGKGVRKGEGERKARNNRRRGGLRNFHAFPREPGKNWTGKKGKSGGKWKEKKKNTRGGGKKKKTTLANQKETTGETRWEKNCNRWQKHGTANSGDNVAGVRKNVSSGSEED